MKTFSLNLTVLLLALSPACLIGQVIVDGKARTQLRDGMVMVLENEKALERPSLKVSPFLTPEAPVVAPIAVTPQQTQRPVEEFSPVILSDDVALNLIARQFRPIGSLVRGDQGVLRLRNGGSIAKGDSFRANIQGYAYEVLIDDVTESGYILKLGSASVARGFFAEGNESPSTSPRNTITPNRTPPSP